MKLTRLSAAPVEVDEPDPLPPARGRGFLAERLLSVNGLVSLAMLAWSAIALRRPSLARGALATFRRRAPWLLYGRKGRERHPTGGPNPART